MIARTYPNTTVVCITLVARKPAAPRHVLRKPANGQREKKAIGGRLHKEPRPRRLLSLCSILLPASRRGLALSPINPQYAHDGIGQVSGRGAYCHRGLRWLVVPRRSSIWLAEVRRWLDPADRDAATRGREILYLHKFILVASAVVVVWAVLFKLPSVARQATRQPSFIELVRACRVSAGRIAADRSPTWH